MKPPVDVDVLPIKDAECYKCTICSSTLQHPVYLPCNHAFCAKCIARLLAGAKWMNQWSPGKPEDRACPNCRDPIIKVDLARTDGDGQHLRDLWLKIDHTLERSAWLGFIHGSGLLVTNQLREFNRGGNTVNWSRKTLRIVGMVQEGIEGYEEAIHKARQARRSSTFMSIFSGRSTINDSNNNKAWWDIIPFNIVPIGFPWLNFNWTTWRLITTGITIGISSSPQLDIQMKKKAKQKKTE